MLRLGSLFSGSGGFELAGLLQGILPVWCSEIEPYPIAVTTSRFPNIKHLGNVKFVDGSKIEPVDIITFGSPCFPAGTLVQTNRGLLPIENVRVKDKVLTHTNSWKKVELVGSKMTDKIVELNIMGSPVMETTTNHPFYVCKRKKDYSVYYVDGVPKRHNKKGLSSPQWIEAKDIEIGDFVGIPINLNSTNKYNLTRSECYLLGRYVADGYIDNNKRPHRENSYNHKTIFCIGNKKLDDFLKNVKGYNVSAKSTNNNCKKCEIISERLMNLCGFCGRGANNKTIPKFVMDLPVEHLKCFLDGYISGDGCFRKCWQASTVSKNLAYQLQAAVAKVYNTYAKIYFIKTADTHKIEERIVNQSDIYMIRFQKEARKQDKYIFKDNMIWIPVKGVKVVDKVEKVYNLQVADDNSYTAFNIAVHNCQNLSIAGNQKGLEGEQSSLFYEAIRIIKEMRSATDGLYPRIAVWENVPGAFSSNKGEDFRTVLQEFVNICEPSAVVPKVPKAGWAYYDCWYGDRWSIAYRTFDAQHWGVPQRRRRIYLVADFRGRCAKEILFKQDGLRGYFEKGRTPWQEIATNAPRSFRANDCVGIDPYNGDVTGDKSATLGVNCRIATGRNGVLIPITFEPGILKREGGHTYEGVAGTIRANAGDNQLAVACGIDCQTACDSELTPSVICMATQQGGAEVRDDNKAPTLTAAAGMSGNNQPVICFHLLQDPISSDKVSPCVSCGNSESGQAALGIAYVMVENHPADSRIDIDDSGTCQTLTGRMGTGGGNVPMVMHVDISDNSSCHVDKQIAYSYNIGDRYGVPNEHIEKCPTLTARCGTGGNNVPAVVSVDMGGGKSVCVSHEDVSPTLTCTHYGAPAVAYLANGEKVVETLSASQGDKMFLGNQEAFSGAFHIVECTIDKNEQCFCVGNGQAGQTYLKDKAGALNCMHDQQCVLKAIALDRATFNAGKTQQGFEISETVNAPLVATGPSAVAYRNIKYIVRRITPVECARLQGFPDKWGVPSKKTDFTDEEYKFWLSVRQTFAQINNKQSLDWNKQSMLTWYNKLHTDSAEYKMWGNGVALPTTLYVMQGIRMVYEKESSDSL